MSETNSSSNARRRLDLNSAHQNKGRSKVKNPYLKAPKKASATVNVEEEVNAAATSTITPETGIEKFFVSKSKAGDAKPSAARKLVTPRDTDNAQQQQELTQGQKRSLQFTNSEDEDTKGLYYHSDGNSKTKNNTKKKKVYEPGHIHSTLDYAHRGETALDQGALNAYRFIRNHFLIPCDIEANSKFGPHSGTSFEQRVIRAYTLGLLETKDESISEDSLLVCSYCGDEGHKRDECTELL